jgi:glycerate kinase
MSDGGEGFLQAFSGRELLVEIDGPLGTPHVARALLETSADRTLGIIESAEALGRQLLPNPTSAMALAASSAPLGHLLLACRDAGATELLVGLGGTCCSDGGDGVAAVLLERGGLDIPTTLACDVDATYLEAVNFAEQKGVARTDLGIVAERLLASARRLEERTGVNPIPLSSAGAAGGIGGALLCLGAHAMSGADVVADRSGLSGALETATLLVTGEGALDESSLQGKVVGHLLRSTPRTCTIVVIAGRATAPARGLVQQLRPGTVVRTLDSIATAQRSLRDPLSVATELLDQVVAEDC